jgi:hypothetical protein
MKQSYLKRFAFNEQDHKLIFVINLCNYTFILATTLQALDNWSFGWGPRLCHGNTPLVCTLLP